MTKKLKKQLTELIIFAGIVLWCVFNYNLFFDFIKFVLKLAMPIIVGIAIAFIINVPMKQIERKIFNIDKRKHNISYIIYCFNFWYFRTYITFNNS